MSLRPATPDEQRQLDRMARGSSAWRWIGAAWLGATGVLVVLGILYRVTRARALRESSFVLVVGAVGLSAYLYVRRRCPFARDIGRVPTAEYRPKAVR
jgi:hypothetical protein